MAVRPGRQADIDVQIDEIVVHGVVVGDRDAVRAAVVRELEARLSSAGPALPVGSVVRLDRLDAGEIPTPSGDRGSRFGADLGRALHASLSGPSARALGHPDEGCSRASDSTGE